MAGSSIYQRFLRVLWTRLNSEHPNVVRPKQSICLAIPKASSFYLGRSPSNGKHVLVHVQPNPKPWKAGQFTINVNVSAEYGPAKGFSAAGSYLDGEEGFYRLGVSCLGGDRWWCLEDRDRSLDATFSTEVAAFDPLQEDARFFKGNWRAPDYSDDDRVIDAAVADVMQVLERHVFQHFGWVRSDSL